jgi:predicted PurR-regulated permease PerM
MGYLVTVVTLFAVQAVLSTMFTWLAIKVSYVTLTLQEIAIIAVTTTLCSFLPYIGLPLSLVLFIFLLMRYSGCSGFDAAAVAIFTKVFVLGGFILTKMAIT